MEDNKLNDDILEFIKLHPNCLPTYVDTDFVCNVCNCLLLQPFQLSCNHILCQICLKELNNNPAKKCFICAMAIEGQVKNDIIKAKVLNIQINCPGKIYNCKWRGKLLNLLAHYDSCDFNSKNNIITKLYQSSEPIIIVAQANKLFRLELLSDRLIACSSS